MKVTGFWMEGDTLIERRSEDVEPHLEQAKALRSCGLVGSSEMRHAAQFPASVVENYCTRMGITLHEWMANPAHVKNMLNDPELSGFRIWEGRV